MAEFLKKYRTGITWVMLGVGLVVFLVGMLADSMGLGTGPAAFGPKQIGVVVAGVALLCGAYSLGSG